MLEQTSFREMLSYDPETGVFVWTKSPNSYKNGDVAGSLDSYGYRRISIFGRFYKAHRLAWFYVHGAWPIEIDHINGIRDDNRLSNLRPADRFINTQNQRRRCTNKSGFIGVSYSEKSKKWKAQIRANHQSYGLGLHETPEAAHLAYLKAKAALHNIPAPSVGEKGEGK